jgi:CheY-like chemotaxis protein
MNLCTNAYQAMDEKGTLVIELHELFIAEETLENYPKVEKAGHYLLIEVSDTGSGIPPELINRIFDPFFTTKEVGKGTGLGLATVHGLVAEMKGSIYVYSELERGTSFKIYLPAIEAEGEEQLAALPEKQAPAAIAPSRDALEKHILVVDDEQLIRQMLIRTLNNLGYRVSACNNGEEALQAFEEHPDEYDLIITDQTMPRMTGIELAKNVLNVSSGQAIILATGYSKVITEQEFSAVNIRKIMNKPFHMQELTQAVSEILNS